MMRQDDTLIPDDAVMGRPPKAIKLQNPKNIRFTEDQSTRIDKLLEDGIDTWPTVGIHNRNDLIRYLVEEALKVVKPPKRRR